MAVLLVSLFGLIGVVGVLLALRSSPPQWPAWALTATLVGLTFWLVVYARGEDTYFQAGDVSRWDFAGRDGNQWMVVAAFALTAAAVVTLLWGAGKGKVDVLRVGYGGAAASSLLLFVATFVLSVGH
jgi:hypothetical protein